MLFPPPPKAEAKKEEERKRGGEEERRRGRERGEERVLLYEYSLRPCFDVAEMRRKNGEPGHFKVK